MSKIFFYLDSLRLISHFVYLRATTEVVTLAPSCVEVKGDEVRSALCNLYKHYKQGKDGTTPHQPSVISGIMNGAVVVF